jgi:hypothetical protein
MNDNPWSTYGAWVIQCDTTQVMVMDLFMAVQHPGPQQSVGGVQEVECARLEYRIRLSRLHIPDPPLAKDFPGGGHLAT